MLLFAHHVVVVNMGMYLIIEASNLTAAKAILGAIMHEKGHTQHNYDYIVGNVNIGYANSTVIKNSIALDDWGNGNFCFEFDMHIVKQFNTEITEEVLKYNDIHWCTAEEARTYLPEGGF